MAKANTPGMKAEHIGNGIFKIALIDTARFLAHMLDKYWDDLEPLERVALARAVDEAVRENGGHPLQEKANSYLSCSAQHTSAIDQRRTDT